MAPSTNVIAAHLGFKAVALIVYLLSGAIDRGFVDTFVVVTLLRCLAAFCVCAF